MPRFSYELGVFLVLLCIFCTHLTSCTGGNLPSCKDRGRNCSLCLQDGNCGFCDSCGDHCHKPGAIHSLKNCTDCSACVPGTLAGANKGTECRPEWFFFEKCPEVVSEKKTVYVEIALYLMNIHSVDMKAGTFNADYYLYFKVPPGQTTYTKQKCKDGINGACFELVNAVGHAEVTSHEGKYFRVKSAFNFAVDVQNYPYDNQTLRIVIQDMEMSAKELRWRVMKGSESGDFRFRSGVSPTLNYTGWLFDTNSWSQMVYEKYNPFLDQGVSRYEFLFHMKRHKRAAFFKNFLPPLFIVLVIGFSFSIPPKDATMRLWIDGSLLVSAVMFHATVGNETPDSQELTLADRFMVGVYSFIFVSFVVTIIMLRLQRENYYFLADVFYGYTEWLVWFTGPTFFFLLYYLKMSLYHVLLSELLIACGGLTTCKLLSYIKCIFQRFLHVDERAVGVDDEENKTHQAPLCGPSGYQSVPQEDQKTTPCSHPPLPTRPCFPGTPTQSPYPCPKQNNVPNKAA